MSPNSQGRWIPRAATANTGAPGLLTNMALVDQVFFQCGWGKVAQAVTSAVHGEWWFQVGWSRSWIDAPSGIVAVIDDHTHLRLCPGASPDSQ